MLYIESFGNPRKFARTARRVGARIPVLTVHAGRSEAGQQAAASHTAAIATPLVSREALFEQAGIIATPGFGELVEVTALLAYPATAGRAHRRDRVQRRRRRRARRRRLHRPRACRASSAGPGSGISCTRSSPGGGAVTGPVDTTATVSLTTSARCSRLLTADEDVDAIIALVLRTGATGDLVAAITDADIRRPARRRRPRPGGGGPAASTRKDGKIPAYAYPEAAAGALARAARYGEWRAAPHAWCPRFADVDAAEARP